MLAMIKCKRFRYSFYSLALRSPIACSVTGGGGRILRLWGLVVGQRLEANNAYGNISITVMVLHRISPVGYDSEGAVGREQGLFFMGNERSFLHRLEMLAVGRYRNTPQRAFLIILTLYTHQRPQD